MFYKTKSQVRAESADALAEFLAKGGTVEVAKASKKGAKNGRKMSCKSSRGYATGTGGFPVGYTRSRVG